MDMLVFRIGMAGNVILVSVQPHTVQEALPHLAPLVVGQLFAGGNGKGSVQGCLLQPGVQLANHLVFAGNLLGRFARHVAVDKVAAFLAEVVFKRTTKVCRLGEFTDHWRLQFHEVPALAV
jgi:hypothetical protein